MRFKNMTAKVTLRRSILSVSDTTIAHLVANEMVSKRAAAGAVLLEG